MKRSTRRRLILAAALFIPLMMVLRLAYLHHLGAPINWLAELWGPFLVLSLGVVTYAENVAGEGDKAGPDAAGASRGRGRNKADS